MQSATRAGVSQTYPPLCCAADKRRYNEQCNVYEKANPGWKAFQARAAAARAARSAARTPPAPPPSAQEAYTEEW